jgi:hypothetical protein
MNIHSENMYNPHFLNINDIYPSSELFQIDKRHFFFQLCYLDKDSLEIGKDRIYN